MKRCGVYEINKYLVFTQVFHLQGPHLETYSSLTKRLYLSVYGTVYFSYLQVLKYNDHKLNITVHSDNKIAILNSHVERLIAQQNNRVLRASREGASLFDGLLLLIF